MGGFSKIKKESRMRKVSISSPSGEGGGSYDCLNKKLKLKVSISSPSGEGGGVGIFFFT